MIIAAFGTGGPLAPLSTDILFPDTQGNDEWIFEMPPVAAQVGGASGAFDYFGDALFPVNPVTVVKSFVLTGTYTDIQDDLSDIAQKVLAFGQSRLWGLPRGASAGEEVWAYSKCIGIRANESSDGKRKLALPVQMTFFCPEGIWYEKNASQTNITANGTYNLTNSGQLPALVTATLTPATTKVEKLTLNNTFNNTSVVWDDTGGAGVAPTKSLIINSEAYSVLNDGSDAYDKLSIGSGQVAWSILSPNVPPTFNTMQVTVVQTGGTFTLNLLWKIPFGLM